ncbi:MAG TPA: ABC transporter permease [Gemmatimonadaceae bacterium]|nr:ABC transporter permease [Gemmatimonadaceae bacterium]
MRFDIRPGVRRLLRLPARSRDQIDDELQDELDSLLGHRVDELLDQGLSYDEAVRVAERHLGMPIEQARTLLRGSIDDRERRKPGLEFIAQDVRLAFRLIRRFPVFAAIVVLTIALGIGATTAIFSAVDAVVLRPLPFADGDRIVSLWGTNPDKSIPRFGVSYPDFRDWKARTRSFDDMALYVARVTTMISSDGPESVASLNVSSNFLKLLGIKPMLGRGFGSDDERGESSNSVILSHGFWQRRFAGDPSVIGRTVSVSGRPRTIIGVLPPESALLGPAFVGTPLDVVTVVELSTFSNVERHAQHLFGAIARLKPGAGIDRARADVSAVETQVAKENPEIAGWSASVFFLTEDLSLGTKQPLLILLAASGLLLIIACINVANLMLVRGAVRGRETAVRQALGASQARLAAQFIVESLVLALCGGALGIGVAALAVGAIRRLIPFGVIARADDMTIDARVILFAIATSLFTSLAFGLWPALRIARLDAGLSSELRSRSPGSGVGAAVRRMLVVAELSLALVLVACAGLVWQSVRRMLTVNPGFRPDHVVTASITLGSNYPDSAAVSFYQTLTTDLEARPGIEAAGAADTPPLGGGGIFTSIRLIGEPPRPADQPLMSTIRSITPGYFRALGMQVLKGRDLEWNESTVSMVVSKSAADAFWPRQTPLNREIAFNTQPNGFPVVGEVNDTRQASLTTAPAPIVYMFMRRYARVFHTMTLIVRGRGTVASTVGTIRDVLHEVDPTLPLYNVQTMESIVDQSTAQQRLNIALLGVFASAALVLAALGIYGVVSYSVTQRRQEMGVRLTLGAQRADILRLILGEGFALAAIGVAIGVGGGLLATRLLRSWLFEIGPGDPLTFTAAAASLVAVALIASYLPARRAARVDPLVTIRAD